MLREIDPGKAKRRRILDDDRVDHAGKRLAPGVRGRTTSGGQQWQASDRLAAWDINAVGLGSNTPQTYSALVNNPYPAMRAAELVIKNVAKHAGPTRARVHVVEQPDELYFEIADDGVGCDGPARRHTGTGLTNMTERVAALRGSLTVDSSAGHEMQVSGRIPLAARH